MMVQMPPQAPVIQAVSVPRATTARQNTFVTPQNPVKFRGSFSSTSTVKAKVPARVNEQIEALAKKLDKTPEEVATAASRITMHVFESKFSNPKTVGLVKNLDSQEAVRKSAVSTGDDDSNKLYSAEMPSADWKQWKKANLIQLTPGRSLGQRIGDIGSKKAEVSFKYTSPESEGAAAFFAFVGMIACPPLALVALPELLLSKNRPQKSLMNGLNVLEQAAEAKQKDPSVDLVLVNDMDWGEGNKRYVHIWKEDNIFSNLNKPADQTK